LMCWHRNWYEYAGMYWHGRNDEFVK